MFPVAKQLLSNRDFKEIKACNADVGRVDRGARQMGDIMALTVPYILPQEKSI